MKIAIKIIIGIVILFAGYLLGSYFPISGFATRQSIIGNAGLKVTVLKPDGKPLSRTEVDLAEEPGVPKIGGAVKTDAKGVAEFHVKPGTYLIFFNASNFPKGLVQHDMPQVTLTEGKTVTQTIKLFPTESN